ncbi:hypothetical protein P8C59_005226 [Phyllachora maydis]|uniref:USP domain-containing protein n=1 Tax=Phyllachora maydis TaxID=1825666 RepID=A0AAD9MB88_9PEZI|nr:hypothetical protein P8C59_005226 [Phyllachora maydis]
MKSALVPRKFRSVREKGSAHRRNKSSDPGARPRLSQDVNGLWNAIFKSDATKQAQKEKEESEKEATKISDISKRLDELNYHNIAEEHIRIALLSKYAAGNVDKTVELLQLQQQAFAGILQPYNPNIQMLGAQNRGAVTCYLDALLFAMFAKLTAFECMLKNDSTDQAGRNLAAWLRLWVNMLRSGKLIHTDMTERIQEALAECGWTDAKELEQQDTSEAFGFITEKLQLPLLALQVDLFHQGKGVKLEDCLEEYFNNKVDVHRDSLDEKRGLEKAVSTPRSTIRRFVVDKEGHATDADAEDTSSLVQMAKRTGSTVVKAVTIPAWQFFRLIPWHAASNTEPQNDDEVARHFNQRPVVGICLKSDPPPDYEEAQWAKFDDLAVDNRVAYVDDIKQALRDEMPYLLFYQIVPMLDVTTASSDGSVTEPPSYDDLKNQAGAQTPNPEFTLDVPGSISRSASGYFDSATTLIHVKDHIAAWERGVLGVNDESTASRLSKAAARFKAGTKSRPTSQAGEGRISQTMSRLGFRNSKDPLRESSSTTLPDLDAAASSSTDEQLVIVEVEEDDVAGGGEAEKEHQLHLHRKDRGKCKSREKEESKKEKAKVKDKDSNEVPDREQGRDATREGFRCPHQPALETAYELVE